MTQIEIRWRRGEEGGGGHGNDNNVQSGGRYQVNTSLNFDSPRLARILKYFLTPEMEVEIQSVVIV